MNAPVCLISNDQTIEQKRRKQLDGSVPTLPTIPKATDLPSALRAIQQLTHIVNKLTGAADNIGLGNFNTRGSGQSGSKNTPGKAGEKPEEKGKKSRWIECERRTEIVRVYNEDDDTQFVDIERINHLVMLDTVTGSRWTWNR